MTRPKPTWLPLTIVCLASSGCMSPWFTQKDETRSEIGSRRDAIRERLQDEERPTMVNQIAAASLLTQAKIENIGLVTQLNGTGGEVNKSPQREKMLDVMRRKDAERPTPFLDDASTALVVATAFVPPAAARGEKLDVLVKLSSHAEGTDLRHGWLLETGLMEMSVLGGELREGFELAKVEGYLVTEQQRTGSKEPQSAVQGMIVGGARLLKGRDLGITVDADFADAITMSAIVPAINRRFTYFKGQTKSGIATPREGGSFVEIKVPPKYMNDPFHFINVVLRVSFNESESQRAQRIETLKRQLREPTTVRNACWEMEAIGEEMIPLLAEVVDHPDPEISFYAAHTLAYLDDPRAIPRLTALCLKEAAFRAMCLNGLVAISSYEAADALRELVHAANAEVKFGAVLALRRRDASDPSVASQAVEDAGYLLEIPSTGPPLVAVSLSQTPEIILFGGNPQLHVPAFAYVNPRMIISPEPEGGLKVTAYAPGEEDQIVNCASDLRSALMAIAEAGGTFGDWVQFVRESHESGYFIEPFAMNPIPAAGRIFQRSQPVQPGDSVEGLYEATYINPDVAADAKASRKSLWNPLTWTE